MKDRYSIVLHIKRLKLERLTIYRGYKLLLMSRWRQSSKIFRTIVDTNNYYYLCNDNTSVFLFTASAYYFCEEGVLWVSFYFVYPSWSRFRVNRISMNDLYLLFKIIVVVFGAHKVLKSRHEVVFLLHAKEINKKCARGEARFGESRGTCIADQTACSLRPYIRAGLSRVNLVARTDM